MQGATVGIIGTGEMGSAVAKRLHDGGCAVVVCVEGRSAASRQRVAALGIPAAESANQLAARADLVLSIVPPGQARQAAGTIITALRAAPRLLTFADCNAISPGAVREMAADVQSAGASFLDAGIIGGPPRLDESGPIFFISGERTTLMTGLREAGLDVRVLGGGIGSASALKMSYAGITKGLTALCALMQQHARAHDLGAELDAVLRETRPDLWQFLERAVPGMPRKAYRWVDEMREIAAYMAPDEAGETIYEGAAQFYERIAREVTLPFRRD